MKCRICSAKTDIFDNTIIMGKYEATFSQCQECGFIQADNPYWLDESYAEPVSLSDVGMVRRTFLLAQVAIAVISVLLSRNGRYVDYGGGYGLFTRLMRDRGFDFSCFDKYCKNIFAPEFSVSENGEGMCEMVTAFEVMEHLADPLTEFSKMLSFSHNVLVTTELVPSNTPKLNDWWYYGVEHGQHISFYTINSLRILAARHHLFLATNGRNIHFFSKKNVNPTYFRTIISPAFSWAIRLIYPNGSLLESDFNRCRTKVLGNKVH